MSDTDDDETIVFRPSKAISQPSPLAEPPILPATPALPEPPVLSVPPPPDPVPLRDPVLAGAFFGIKHAAAAEQLADFIASGPEQALSVWFGRQRAIGYAVDAQAARLALDRDIAAIDGLISAQLDAILHHDKLRRLEGRWRGAHWLLAGIDPRARIKIKLLDAGWSEICRDLERAAEFDQSLMFRKIYEEEFGTPGGEPYGLLVIDHEVRHRPAPGAPTDDVAGIAAFSAIAAAAFAPTVIAAHPALLQVDQFSDLATVSDITSALRGPDHARWNALSAREDMRFVAVVLPRLLARCPWADDPARGDGFRYAEHAPDCQSRVWSNAGFAFAAVVARAYAAFNWPGDVRGSDTDRIGGGLVTQLPVDMFATDPPHVWIHPPLEIIFSDRQERSLADIGLMPLSALPYGEEAIFGGARSLQAPASYVGATAEVANANARISAQLNAMLCASRFAHYLKVKGRDMVGGMRTGEEMEQELQAWLTGYTNASVDGGAETRARYPLVDARISLREKPGQPGVYTAVVHLQPHFQLDDVAASFRLVTEIAKPASQRAA